MGWTTKTMPSAPFSVLPSKMEPPGSEMRNENLVEKSAASTCASEKMLPARLANAVVRRMTTPSLVVAGAAEPLIASPVVSEKSVKSTTSAAAMGVSRSVAMVAVRSMLFSLS